MSVSQTDLYVTDLPVNCTAEFITDMFKEYGEVLNVQLIPKHYSMSCRVSFSNHESAKNAKEQYNYAKVAGKTIYILYFNSDTSNDPRPETTIEISNFPGNCAEPELENLMKEFGEVVICRIIKNKNGSYSATVQFEKSDSAESAIKQLNGAKINDHLITVSKFDPKLLSKDVNGLQTPLPLSLLCISGDKSKINSETLFSKFSKYGKIYHIAYVEDSAVLFFSNHESALQATSDFHDPSLTISNRMRSESVINILAMVEARKVLIANVDMSDPNIAEVQLREHMSQVGQLLTLDIDKVKNLVTAQYENIEDRNRALRELDRTIFGQQKSPIRVLPFYEKRVQHPQVGFIQLNEIPPWTTMKKLHNDFQKYGNVLATTLTPTDVGGLIGFVLFERYENAVQAKKECGLPNVILHTKMNPTDIMIAFTDNEKTPNNCLVLYDLPTTMNDKEITKECQKYGYIQSLASTVNPETKTKTTFAFYTNKATDAYCAFKAEGRNVDVLNEYALNRSFARFQIVALPTNWKGCVCFVAGFPLEYTNQNLRTLMEQYGPVEAAVINLFPNGVSQQSGIVVFANADSAYLAINSVTFVSDSTRPIKVDEYKKQAGFEQPAYVAPPPKPKYSQPANCKTPREYMRKFVELNFENPTLLLDQINRLSVDQTYQFTADTFIRWIENINSNL